jgi:hypothetical protein
MMSRIYCCGVMICSGVETVWLSTEAKMLAVPGVLPAVKTTLAMPLVSVVLTGAMLAEGYWLSLPAPTR